MNLLQTFYKEEISKQDAEMVLDAAQRLGYAEGIRFAVKVISDGLILRELANGLTETADKEKKFAESNLLKIIRRNGNSD